MRFPSGNGCGHRRDDPRLRLPWEPKTQRPPFVRKLQARCETFYWNRAKLLAPLGISARSERAEACVLVLKALLSEWDQVTSRVGWPRPDGRVAGVPLTVLAERTGLNICRIARVVHVLSAAGYLEGGQPREHKNDRWIGYPSVRRINWRLFYLVGISQTELTLAARKARRRLDSSPQPPSLASDRPAQPKPADRPTAVGAVVSATLRSHAATAPRSRDETAQRRVEIARQLDLWRRSQKRQE